MRKFLATVAVLGVPTLAMATTLQNLLNAIPNLGGLVGPVLGAIFLPWVVVISLIGYFVWKIVLGHKK